jgi:hypothetical protein
MEELHLRWKYVCIQAVRFLHAARHASMSQRVQTGFWGPLSPSYTMTIEAPSQAIKRPGREADHFPPSSVEVKNLLTGKSSHAIGHGNVELASDVSQTVYVSMIRD